MSCLGDCFIVLPSHSEDGSVIFGRNSTKRNEEDAEEVVFFPSASESQSIQCDGGVTIEDWCPQNSIILCRYVTKWGGECGANEKNVCIGVTWCDGESKENSITSSDIIRLALEGSATASEAVDAIGSLVTKYASDQMKTNFVICDCKEVWVTSTGGKLWAAEQLVEIGFKRISSNGLFVKMKIDKSCENLGDKLKDLGFWDGNEDINFSAAFNSPVTEEQWPSKFEPTSNGGTFCLTDMFELLRYSGIDLTGSSQVSVIASTGIPCHWFTATPNPKESVFKPFVFAPKPRISPLTKVRDSEEITTLHKLHGQRNWDNVGNLLKSLESTCVNEVKKFLIENPSPNEELDELMKDCVEAEVKFYR